MNLMFRLIGCSVLLSLAACGGSNDVSVVPKSSARLAAAIQAAPLPEVVLPGYRSQYTIAASGGNFLVTDITTNQTSTYTASQRLRLADGGVAFDLAGTAGQSYRIYQAAFDRVPDKAGLGFYINALDTSGLSLDVIAQSFIDSQEFSSKYGSLSNSAFLTVLYNNVLKRIPDQAGFDYNLSYLDGTNATGTVVTRAQMLKFFSESAENVALTEPGVRNGIDYLPWGMTLPQNPVANYAGSFSGNFGGTDGGPFSMTASSAGAVTLTGHANTANADLAGSGEIKVGGVFTATLAGGGRTMNLAGSVNEGTGFVTGTWTYQGMDGGGVFVGLKAVAQGPQFSQVKSIIQQRCVPCHSVSPTQPGYPTAPLGIRFDTETDIRNRADQIYSVAVQSQYMPYLNITNMTQAERDYLNSWFQAGKP